MPGERDYSRIDRWESRFFLANGRASCPAPHLSIGPRFQRSFSNNVAALSVAVPSRTSDTTSAAGSPAPRIAGHVQRRGGGRRELHLNSVRLWRRRCPRRLLPGGPGRAGESSIFPLRDQAVVKAIACEAVSQTQLPLSRLSSADLAAVRLRPPSAKPSAPARSGGSDADAIKPWRYEYWIFPQASLSSPRGPGESSTCMPAPGRTSPLGSNDYIVSSDEKTSIQARIRCHPTLPTGSRAADARRTRVRAGAGALQYLAGVGTSAADGSWAGARKVPGSSRSAAWSSR